MDRSIPVLTAAFAAGVVVARRGPVECLVAAVAAPMLALAAAAAAPRLRSALDRRLPSVRAGPWIVAAAAVAGVCRAVIDARAPVAPSVAALAGDGSAPVRLRGVVAKAPDPPAPGERPFSSAATLDVRFASRAGETLEVATGGVLVYRVAGLRPGDEVEVEGRLRLPAAPTNPGQRPAAESLRARGAVAILDAGGEGAARVLRPAPPWHPARASHAARIAVLDAIRRTTAGEGGALVEALVLGRVQGLDPDLVRALRRTGTWHVLVVSGFHVALVGGATAWALHRAGTGRWSALLALPAVAAFVAIAGMAFPVRRAAVAAAIVAAAPLLRRSVDGFHLLALAAAAEIAARPSAVADPGFLLTLAAVTGLLAFTRPLASVLFRRRRLLRRFPLPAADRGVARRCGDFLEWSVPPTLAAWAATALVTATQFCQVALIGPLANLLVAPLASLAVLAAPALIAFGFAAPTASAAVADGAAALLRGWTAAMDALPAGCPPHPPPASGAVVAAAACMAAVARGGGPRTAAGAAVLLGAPLLLVLPAAGGLPSVPAGAVVLDTGHGLSVLVAGGRGRVLVDAGGRSPATAATRLLPALRAEGVTALDALVLSHGDADHAGGAGDVLGAVPVGALVVAEGFGDGPSAAAALAAAESRRVPVIRVAAGDIVRVRDAVLEVLAPPRGSAAAGRSNDGSLVVRWRGGGRSLLLPGDAEDRALRDLLLSGADLRADALVLPHHGSARVRTAPLLAAATGATDVFASDGPATGAHGTVPAPAAPRYGSTHRDGAIRWPRSGSALP